MLCVFLLGLAAAPAPTALRAPVFEVHALGVLGGEDDSNLSAYVVGTAEQPAQLLIDGGAFTAGLYAWKLAGDPGTPSQRAAVLSEFFRSLTGVLITHSHLDHVGGLLVAAPALFGAGRKKPLPLWALPQTVATLRDHALRSPLWVDLTATPKDAPVIALNELPAGKPVTLGELTVESVALVHPVPSAAYLVSKGAAHYLHLGDTGPSEAVWKRARELLEANTLRGIAVEVSFPSKDEALAKQTGHLTPALLLEELGRLTGTRLARGTDPKLNAKALGAALGDCKVMAIHIKAAQYEKVVEELRQFEAVGLPVIIPRQGSKYTF
ncbi:MAG: 3',5'-cyclic-nucleotide phosphodiesterase [Archangiaceae bacterium]|nr:3',5'-cyclic-nucleotide phosphodiesterase [Archangiaceae bacterium]